MTESSRLLEILSICQKWRFVSSIRNLPSHIYGSLDLVNNIKKADMVPHPQRIEFCNSIFEEDVVYSSFTITNPELSSLSDFMTQSNNVVSELYSHDVLPADFFQKVHEISEATISSTPEFAEVSKYIEFLQAENFGDGYCSPQFNLHLE